MTTFRQFTLTALIALGLPMAAAADPSMECSTESASQVEIGDCLAKTEQRVDTAMAQALSFAMAAATDLDKVTGRASSVPALTSAQAVWSTYRDQHCDFVGTTFGGGSGTGIAIRSCRITLGRARTDDLMNYTQ